MASSLHPKYIALPFGHGNNAARVKQIKDVGRLYALIVGGKSQEMLLALVSCFEQRLAFFFGVAKMLQQQRSVGVFEIVARILLLCLQKYVAIEHAAVAVQTVEIQIVDVVDALAIHRQPFQPVCDLSRDRIAIEASNLLEIGELRHFHAVAPHFPAKPPRAKRRAFPVVFDKTNVVLERVNADAIKAFEIEVLNVRWATASGSPGIDSNAGACSGFRHSDRRSACRDGCT